MASITAPLHSVPVESAGSTATRLPAYVAPSVAVVVGALSGVLATWAIVATQTLQMSL